MTKRIHPLYLLLLTIAGLYFFCIPTSLLTLDYAELLSSVEFDNVIHPPGYPLYFWLYKLNLLLPISDFITPCLSVASLFLIAKQTHSQIRLPLIMLLSVSTVYWEYSYTLDVFMLHIFIICLGSYFFFKGNYMKFAFVWAIASANHLTIIFVYPLLILAFLENKKVIFSFALGTLFSLLLYLSLLSLNTKSLYSWGQLDSIQDLTHHFLRMDYGTLKLSAGGEEASFLLNFTAFIKTNYLVLTLCLALLFSGFSRTRNTLVSMKQEVLYLICILFYIVVFFSMSNINPSGTGLRILERFMLMPIVMICILSLRLTNYFELRPSKLFLIPILLICIQFYQSYEHIHRSQHKTIELWARDKIEWSSGLKKPVIILENRDSFYFPLAHLLKKKKNPNITVISYRLLFHQWYFEKVKKRFPKLKLNRDKILREKNLNLVQDLIMPNLEEFIFNTDLDIKGIENFLVSPAGKFFGLKNLKAKPFRGNFDKISMNSKTSEQLSLRWLCLYLTAKGVEAYRKGDENLAINYFHKASNEVFYCYRAHLNLCQLKKRQCPTQEEIQVAKKYFQDIL